MIDMLDNVFKLNVNGTNIKKEVLAGFTTFITMSYIIFVNPQIMSTTGMDFGAVFVVPSPLRFRIHRAGPPLDRGGA